ncbi:MAG: hypothetical protein LAT84_11285 [Balneolia bacterium]|nr:hypothetical protein [Balneolia bacterium]
MRFVFKLHTLFFTLILFMVMASAVASPSHLVAADTVGQQAIATERITDPQRAFNDANFHYEQRQYTLALERFLQIEQSGFSSGPLFLNTGLTYLNMQEPGRALFYFYRARGYSQTADRAQRAIEFVEETLQQQFAEPPVLATFTWFEWMQFRVGTDIPLLALIMLINLAALFWAGHWFLNRGKTAMRYLAYIAAGLAVVAGGVFVYNSANEGEWQRGMIVEPGFELREQPSEASDPVLVVYPGFRLLLHAESSAANGEWSFVHMSNGLQGWVKSDSLLLFP